MINIKKEKKNLVILIFILVLLVVGILLIKTKYLTPTSVNKEEITQKWLAKCSNDTCVGTTLGVITSKYGPTLALESLEYYKRTYPNNPSGDEHQRAHIVGRETAKTFGVTGDAFLKCPLAFNYGCQHGFFEKALGELGSPKSAIEKICGNFETSSDYSPKFKFYCYHGVGHGVMMAQAYDLKTSLDVCDSLKTKVAQSGCWQGVFMENVNAHFRNEARNGVFSKINSLAPCDTVAEKHQYECYINHAGYLLSFYRSDVAAASTSCLSAGVSYQEACLESLGLAITNEDTQKNLKGYSPVLSVEENGWNICKLFPENSVSSCVLGGVDHILQMDRLNLNRASRFCELVYQSEQEACYQRIGIALRSESLRPEDARKHCQSLPSQGRAACLKSV